MTTPPIHDGTKKWFENATIARKQKRRNVHINYINYINYINFINYVTCPKSETKVAFVFCLWRRR